MKQSCKTVNLILSGYVKEHCSYYNVIYDLSVNCHIIPSCHDKTMVLLECEALYEMYVKLKQGKLVKIEGNVLQSTRRPPTKKGQFCMQSHAMINKPFLSENSSINLATFLE